MSTTNIASTSQFVPLLRMIMKLITITDTISTKFYALYSLVMMLKCISMKAFAMNSGMMITLRAMQIDWKLVVMMTMPFAFSRVWMEKKMRGNMVVLWKNQTVLQTNFLQQMVRALRLKDLLAKKWRTRNMMMRIPAMRASRRAIPTFRTMLQSIDVMQQFPGHFSMQSVGRSLQKGLASQLKYEYLRLWRNTTFVIQELSTTKAMKLNDWRQNTRLLCLNPITYRTYEQTHRITVPANMAAEALFGTNISIVDLPNTISQQIFSWWNSTVGLSLGLYDMLREIMMSVCVSSVFWKMNVMILSLFMSKQSISTGMDQIFQKGWDEILFIVRVVEMKLQTLKQSLSWATSLREPTYPKRAVTLLLQQQHLWLERQQELSLSHQIHSKCSSHCRHPFRLHNWQTQKEFWYIPGGQTHPFSVTTLPFKQAVQLATGSAQLIIIQKSD